MFCLNYRATLSGSHTRHIRCCFWVILVNSSCFSLIFGKGSTKCLRWMKRVSYLGQVDLAIDAVKKPRFLPVVKRLADQLIQHTRQTGFRGRGAPVVGGVDFAAVVLRWSGVWISQPWSYGGRGCHFLFENGPFSTPQSACRKPFPIWKWTIFDAEMLKITIV